MAKSKGKPKLGNIKVYKKPSDKQFLVVTNPWHENQLEKLKYKDVIGWFEVMLRDKYPAKGFRPNAVYFMRTRSDIIVELPGDVEINEYLGAHAYGRFLPPSHISPRDKEMHAEAHVYEYNYAKFNDPNKTGWTEYVDYTAIRPNFPVRSPYPVSLPAPQLPPMEVGHALPIPEAVMVMLREREAKMKEGSLLAESLIAEAFAAMERPSVQPSVPPSPAPVSMAAPAQVLVPMPTRIPAPTPAPSTLSPTLAPPSANDSLFTPYAPPSHHPAHTRYPSVNAGRVPTRETAGPCASSSKVEIQKEEEKVQDPRKTLDPRRRAAAIDLVREDSRYSEDTGGLDLRRSESNNMKAKSEPRDLPGRKKMGKLDPYEEDEVAASLLRSPTTDTIRELSVADSEIDIDVGVKPEEDTSKRESTRHLSSMPSAGPSLSPSSTSRPPSIPRRRCIKPSPVSTSSTPRRQPEPSRSGQSEPATEIGRVKLEPMDIDLPLPLPRPPPLPKRSAFRAALMDGGAAGGGKRGRVKAEPVDQTGGLFLVSCWTIG
ncbi:hypothetical protein BDQ12DRAFT_408590 [Crucibulum laeve]|uniref:Uncharacterized protein n=1 Tax=Crucibulum laeve TaxID=68775 RepID=A0A5C3LL29_9AGAR|nr:hypothetical protein BDQ12DRAFT_408590 [Crucibulum laeve]